MADRSEAVARAHVRVRGRVQGVGFRVSVEDEALRLGLAGWARNCGGDEVECVFEGARSDVDAAVAWCRRGPSLARVAEVSVDWQAPVGERQFRILPSV
jgi:acylphosphatase